MLRCVPFLALLVLASPLVRAAYDGADDTQRAPKEYAQLDVSVVTAKAWGDAAIDSAPLLIHFHGAAETTKKNFDEAQLPGVLVTINCRGLSSAYQRPFENAKLFPYLIEDVKRELVADGKIRRNGKFSSVGLSCFSAGYGAVREILKDSDCVKQVQCVVAADSIYASIHLKGDERTVDGQQMRPFLDFARLAARGERTFLVSHSQLSVQPYASTIETADYLLKELGCKKVPIDTTTGEHSFEPIATATLGRFTVRSFPGSTAQSHLDHLRNIAPLWRAAFRTDAFHTE